MKKLIIAYLFTITNVFGAPPTYFNGELQTNTYIQNIKAPNYQTTPLGGIDRRLETGNLNELQNPNFEHSTVTTGWTVSNATASGNTSAQFEGKKSLSLALTGALSLSQSSTINAARKSGVQMVASLWINSTDVSDLQLCSLKNGSEDKCTVVGGYVQGSGWRQLTVSFIGNATSNGLKLKSTDTTGTVLVDQAFVGVGSPVVDFTPDMVYSAKVSSAGVVTGENTDWINGTCSTVTGSQNFGTTCNFASNIFTVAPNCLVSLNKEYAWTGGIQTVTNSSVSYTVSSAGSGSAGTDVYLICQKQGADYKTSKAYVASSGDTDWASCGHTTSDFTGFGTVTGIETQCKREGSDLLMRGKFTSGTSTGVEARLNLKINGSNLTSAGTSSIPSIQANGNWFAGVASVAHGGAVLIEPSLGYINFSSDGIFGSISSNALTKAVGTSVVSVGNPISINARIPIQGWTDSGVIVGSFQGYNETPGTSRVETFSVSYGTTNATTVCSASPCSYLDQIGNAVTSVTRSTTGDYVLNTSKTYAKLKCGTSIQNNALDFAESSPIRCENCNSVAFSTFVRSTGNKFDTYGTIMCQGTPQ